MATIMNSQLTAAEYHTFKEHYASLVHAIQNPLSLATRLFTRNVIDSSLLQRVNTLGFTTFQNTTTLLTAVLGKIQTDLRMFYEFLSALKEDPSMQSLVESMQGKCFIDKRHISSPEPQEYSKKNNYNVIYCCQSLRS